MHTGRAVVAMKPEEQKRLAELEASLKGQIASYGIKDASGMDMSSADLNDKVGAVLGTENRDNILNDDVQKKPSTSAREAFVNYMMQVLADKGSDFTLPDEGPDPRQVDPAKHAIKLEKLLGAEGVALYKAAIKEEKESIAFRNAVFLKATKHYDGPSWKKRLVMWVGGPSASGKSFSSAVAIKKIGRGVMEENTDNQGNDVVSIDGGIERDTSQMRKLALQVALKKGYPGIADLHKNTELGIKGKIQKAASKNEKLSLVVPNTFSNPFKRAAIINNLAKLDKSQCVFSEVRARQDQEENENNKDKTQENFKQFKGTVERMGNSRAWKQNFDPNEDRFQINLNADVECESKEYQKKYFMDGVTGTQDVKKHYFEKFGDEAIYVPIENDLVFMREATADDNTTLSHVPCEKDYKGAALMISERDYKDWSNRVTTHQNAVQLNQNKSNQPIDIKEFVEAHKASKPKAIVNAFFKAKEAAGQEITLGEFLKVKKAAGDLALPEVTIVMRDRKEEEKKEAAVMQSVSTSDSPSDSPSQSRKIRFDEAGPSSSSSSKTSSSPAQRRKEETMKTSSSLLQRSSSKPHLPSGASNSSSSSSPTASPSTSTPPSRRNTGEEGESPKVIQKPKPFVEGTSSLNILIGLSSSKPSSSFTPKKPTITVSSPSTPQGTPTMERKIKVGGDRSKRNAMKLDPADVANLPNDTTSTLTSTVAPSSSPASTLAPPSPVDAGSTDSSFSTSSTSTASTSNSYSAESAPSSTTGSPVPSPLNTPTTTLENAGENQPLNKEAEEPNKAAEKSKTLSTSESSLLSPKKKGWVHGVKGLTEQTDAAKKISNPQKQ